ncbi:MAG TPA: hypothetical protein VF747_17710, partial [Blastocatellia bacterium]
DSENTPDLLPLARFPQPLTDELIINRFGLRETRFLRRISDELEIPYSIQSGLGIERQLGKNLVVTVDYVFTRGAHLWRETNINAPVLPPGFSSFSEFLLSRDFENRPSLGKPRPVTGANADVVRFDSGTNTSTTAGAIKVEKGIRVLTLGLNAPRSSNISAALNAIRSLRPDPSLTQIEQLEASGNSFYHGGIFSARYSPGRGAQFRVVYTLSKLIDEGTTNTASPQDLFDRRAERALSLQDQRHRIGFSGQFQVPVIKLSLAPTVSFGSSRPFNIGSGFDRNLNDIQNDRPNFLVPTGRPEWRRPGSAGADLKSSFALAPIGSSGNLPRNYGRGPGAHSINLRASRAFTLGEGIKIRPAIDVFNLFNNAVFNFGPNCEIAKSHNINNSKNANHLPAFLVTRFGGSDTLSLLSLDKIRTPYSSSARTVSRLDAGVPWVYLSVITRSECPAISCTPAMGAPDSKAIVVAVWRRS